MPNFFETYRQFPTWDIVTFSECRSQPQQITIDGNHKLFIARDSYAASGVGILVHERYSDDVSNFTQHSGRLCSLDLKLKIAIFRVFFIYAPHSGFPFVDFEQLMQELMDLASLANRNGFIVIVSGDFNTQLDVGPRGQLLRELSVVCHLRISNEIHDHMDFDDQWTFESSMGVRRQLDFILCSARVPTIAVEATRAIDMGSDHRAVKCIFAVGVPQHSKKRKKRVRG